MNKINHNYNALFMKRAIELSEIAYKTGKGLPIGCVIVKDNKIIAEGHNEIFLRNNPTAHGEMVAIEHACKQTGNILLEGCELYTTLQPCPMCFGAIYWAGLSAVYIANTATQAAAAGFDDSLIFEELTKTPDQRKIPEIHKSNAEAIKVLEDWKLKGLNASQPWHKKG